MSKVSKDFKQVINQEETPIFKPKGSIGFVDEDFIDEYLKEEQEQQINDEEE